MADTTYFHTGQFAGQSLRVELHALQDAERGRKFGVKDRRPIDPPPIIQLRLYSVCESPTLSLTELDYKHIYTSGIVCHVDVFRVRNPPAERTPALPWLVLNPRLATVPVIPTDDFLFGFDGLPGSSDSLLASPPEQDPDPVLGWADGQEIRESDSVTSQTSGARVVEAIKVNYTGEETIVFVFSDLAVKVEGTFVLRYKVFDVRSCASRAASSSAAAPPSTEIPVLAECYSQTPLRVWDTKSFPGLNASTALTQLIALQTKGTRPHVRTSRPARGIGIET